MHPISRRTFFALSSAVLVGACSNDDDDDDDAGATAPTTGPTPAPSTSTASTASTAAPLPEPIPTAPGITEEVAPPSEPAPPSGPAEYADTVDPFTLGVASGDPWPDGAVLWTRLASDPLAGGGMGADSVSVRWEIELSSNEPGPIVASGRAVADPAHGHSVHVEVTGLEPSTFYRYRFITGDHSAEGRFRTAPADATSPGSFTFAAATCQDFEDGYYAAHRDIAERGVELVVFLGDYIYENANGPDVPAGKVRTHNSAEPTDLVGYRNRYALYKSDPHLQRAHAACAWSVIWDDHEVENNYAGDVSQDASPSDEFLARRAAAYKAWWEHMPVRGPAPTGPEYAIHRSLEWGQLIRLNLVDGRQYRSDQACNDVILNLDPACPETFEPERTLIGDDQEQWLFDQLDSSVARWNVVAQTVIFANTQFNGAVLNHDQWDGYPVQRDRVLQHVADAAIANLVVLTGDIHFAGVASLRAPGGPDKPLIGTEFVTTSISSAGNVDASLEPIVAALGDIVDVELAHRGWTMHTVTPDEWIAEYRIVADALNPDSTVETYKRFRIASGSPSVETLA